MPYPTLTEANLASFSGRPVASYTAYAKEALDQAVLLFKIGTCLVDLPASGTVQYELAIKGILAMADHAYLAQPYQKMEANPFSSESIGSYSYGKTAKKVSDGDDTGVMWFDLALDQLSVCEEIDDIPMSGGIQVFEYDGSFARTESGDLRFLSPADVQISRSYGFDPAGSQVIPIPTAAPDSEFPPTPDIEFPPAPGDEEFPQVP